MSVRQSLLAILDQGPCYGHQLRTEFERRTGSAWPLNVGQIYNTLERLERDGLAERDEVDDQGHVYWRISAAGSAEVARWLLSPVIRDAGGRDEAAIKVALAVTLPGVDAGAVVRTQREETRRRQEALATEENGWMDVPEDAAALAGAIVAAARRSAAQAELRWLDEAERLMSATAPVPVGLDVGRPRRGRPRSSPTPRIAQSEADPQPDDVR